jgi:hypothetical protein
MMKPALIPDQNFSKSFTRKVSSIGRKAEEKTNTQKTAPITSGNMLAPHADETEDFNAENVLNYAQVGFIKIAEELWNQKLSIKEVL